MGWESFCILHCFLPSTWKGTGTFCCCSVAQLYPALCNPMDCIMLGFPVLHYLLEFAQTHVHWVNVAIQPPHPLSLTSPLALCWNNELMAWVNLGSSYLDHFQIISFVCAKHLFLSTSHGLQLFFTLVVTFNKTQCCQCSIIDCTLGTSIHISGLAWWGWLDSWLRDSDWGAEIEERRISIRKTLAANINYSKSLKWKPMKEGLRQ